MKKKSFILIALIISIAFLYYIKMKSSTQNQQLSQENFFNSLNNEDQKNFNHLNNEGILGEAITEVENGAKNITHLLNGLSNSAKNLISTYLAYLGYKNIETGKKDFHSNVEEKITPNNNKKDSHTNNNSHDNKYHEEIILD